MKSFHPSAIVESTEIGQGTRIWAFAHILEKAILGRDCNICDHVFIESGAHIGNNVTIKNGVSVWAGITIEDDVFIGPNCAFTNDLNPRVEYKKEKQDWLKTTIRRGATLGANATVLCDLEIGEYALIGAGAVVIGDVPAHGLILGNPGKLVGYVCRCLSKRFFFNKENQSTTCKKCDFDVNSLLLSTK